MQTVLLVGDFTKLGSIVGALVGVRFIHCHSIEVLRREWRQARASAVLMSVREITPSVFELMREGGDLKWAVFVRQGNTDLGAFSGERRVFFKGQPAADWLPRLQRFLKDGEVQHRRAERKPCRGGVRVNSSEYSRQPVAQRAYGRVSNVSSHGAGFVFEQDLPFPVGEFLEVTFRDPQGALRSFHGQIRWKRQRDGDHLEIGLQFLAAAG